ncbi:MAG: Ig-like domain-containing protein [Planctomycetes bacterium]|nr:Ig-like domain-containing protein [Planctomycetota bacterium]
MRSRADSAAKPLSSRRCIGGTGALLLILFAALSCSRGSDVGSRVRRLEIEATATSIVDGLDAALTVTAIERDGDRRDVSALVDWSSSAPAIASVVALPDGSRRARGLAAGSATLTARHLPTGVTTTVEITVTPAELVAVELTPTAASIAAGTSQPFVATGTYSDGSTADLTEQVTWSSSDAGVATVSNAPGVRGEASSHGTGTTTIGAIDPASGASAATSLVVTAASRPSAMPAAARAPPPASHSAPPPSPPPSRGAASPARRD